MKRGIIKIKSHISEVIIEFIDAAGDVVHTVFIDDIKGMRHGGMLATKYPGEVDHEWLKAEHQKNHDRMVGKEIR